MSTATLRSEAGVVTDRLTAAEMDKGERGVVLALEAIRRNLPFASKGLDSDNGSEFANTTWCATEGQRMAMNALCQEPLRTMMSLFQPSVRRVGRNGRAPVFAAAATRR